MATDRAWGTRTDSKVDLGLEFKYLITNMQNGIKNTQVKFKNDTNLKGIINIGTVK